MVYLKFSLRLPVILKNESYSKYTIAQKFRTGKTF